MSDQEIVLNGNGHASDGRRTHIQRFGSATRDTADNLPMPNPGVGINAANLGEVLLGAQTKIEKVMADLSEKLAKVEARATFREKVTITAEAVIIEREMTMAKDRI